MEKQILPGNEELKVLLSHGESERVERKESLSQDAATKIREAICAFANDLAGTGRIGIVFVGVKDDGHPSGLAITDDVLLQLSNMKTDGNILPLPTMTLQRPLSGG